MKKIVILILAIFIGIKVQALENYSEYEFIGYQYDIPVLDLLTKYEPVVLHRYYSLKKSESKYIKEEDISKEYECDISDKKVKNIKSKSPSLVDTNEKNIALLGKRGENVDKITISNIDLRHLAIDIIKISSGDEEWTFPQYEPHETIEISFNSIPINELKISLMYTTDESLSPLISYYNSTVKNGSAYISLDKEYDKIGIDILEPDKHSEFSDELGFSSEKNLYYYTYQEESYMCWKNERIYYENSEIDDIDGYQYDREEDITMYKVYKRQLIKDTSCSQPIKPSDDIINVETDVKTTIDNTKVNNPKGNNILAYTTDQNSTLKIDGGVQDDDTSKESIVKCDSDMTLYEGLKNEISSIYDNMRKIKYLMLILIVFSIIHTVHHFYVNLKSFN